MAQTQAEVRNNGRDSKSQARILGQFLYRKLLYYEVNGIEAERRKERAKKKRQVGKVIIKRTRNQM